MPSPSSDRSKPQRRRQLRGLTLIEVTIVLAVLAILSAIAVPSLGHRLERQRLQSAAETLASDLAEARFEAARRGQPLHLQTRAGSDWCWAVSAVPDCPCGAAQACQLHNVRAADYPGVQLSAGHGVRIDPAGGNGIDAGSSVATFETRHGQRLRVDVSALGRARVCAAGGQWPQLAPC